MFGAPVQSGLTLTKVISGLAKTLSVANQVIPLYKEAKPMINNAKSILSVLKGMNTKETKATNTINEVTKKDPSKSTIAIKNNSPRFFL